MKKETAEFTQLDFSIVKELALSKPPRKSKRTKKWKRIIPPVNDYLDESDTEKSNSLSDTVQDSAFSESRSKLEHKKKSKQITSPINDSFEEPESRDSNSFLTLDNEVKTNAFDLKDVSLSE